MKFGVYSEADTRIQMSHLGKTWSVKSLIPHSLRIIHLADY